MGVPTHCNGSGNGGTGGGRGKYLPPPEHVCAIHCNPSHHGVVFGSGAESGNAPIQAMVGTYRPGYHGYHGGGVRLGGEGGYGGGLIGAGGRGIVGEGQTTDI